jgi:hypothetical protein
MPRLYRPYIPIEIRCRVALRQLGEMWPDDVIGGMRGSLAVLLEELLETLASLLGCKRMDLRLDHDPPLGARPRFMRGKLIIYEPDANHPAHLIYRTKHGHHIKTYVRGDGAQYPDRVLIKRERKRREEKHGRPKRKIASRPFPKGRKFGRRREWPSPLKRN